MEINPRVPWWNRFISGPSPGHNRCPNSSWMTALCRSDVIEFHCRAGTRASRLSLFYCIRCCFGFLSTPWRKLGFCEGHDAIYDVIRFPSHVITWNNVQPTENQFHLPLEMNHSHICVYFPSMSHPFIHSSYLFLASISIYRSFPQITRYGQSYGYTYHARCSVISF